MSNLMDQHTAIQFKFTFDQMSKFLEECGYRIVFTTRYFEKHDILSIETDQVEEREIPIVFKDGKEIMVGDESSYLMKIQKFTELFQQELQLSMLANANTSKQ